MKPRIKITNQKNFSFKMPLKESNKKEETEAELIDKFSDHPLMSKVLFLKKQREEERKKRDAETAKLQKWFDDGMSTAPKNIIKPGFICGACKKSCTRYDGSGYLCKTCRSHFDFMQELIEEKKIYDLEKITTRKNEWSYLQGRSHQLSKIISKLKVLLYPQD